MTINIIAAINNTNSIGKDGKLLIKLESDLHRFRSFTLGHTVILGRKSYEEIGKPLPARKNIVLSRDETYNPHKDVTVVSSLQNVIEQYKNSDRTLWICGGEEVYRQAFPYVDRVYLTKIDDDTVGDTFFPIELLNKNFVELDKEIHEENEIEFEFVDYVRRGDADEQS